MFYNMFLYELNQVLLYMGNRVVFKTLFRLCNFRIGFVKYQCLKVS